MKKRERERKKQLTEDERLGREERGEGKKGREEGEGTEWGER